MLSLKTLRKPATGTLLALAVMLLSYQNCGENPSPVARGKEQISSTDIAPDQDDPLVIEKKNETTFDPILADRYYVVSVLTDVFGPKMRGTDSADVALDAINFGSPCSIYENYDYEKTPGKWSAVDTMNACAIGDQSFLGVGVNPSAQVTRQAQMAHACSDLTTSEATLSYALAKIQNVAVPELTNENLTTAFYLFYKVQGEPTQSLLDSLRVMAPAGGPTRESWRNVIQTLCISSQWQVL